MTLDELYLLTQPNISQLIEDHLEEDPYQFVLQNHHKDIPAQLISTQLKYLQKSRQKLPTYYQNRCILTQTSFEQASSQLSASIKNYEGDSCLDICCGLGVDTLHFSQNFSTVYALERSPVLAKITAHNFAKLQANNIHIECQTAETFLQAWDGPPFDLIYADPSRRDSQGKRYIRLEDCSPDILSLYPILKAKAKKLLFKLSPLYDIQEAIRKFPELTKIHVVSIKNECKELWIEINTHKNEVNPCLEIKRYQNNWSSFIFNLGQQQSEILPFNSAENVHFILEPDAAFYKARYVPQLFTHYFPHLPGALNNKAGFYFCTEKYPQNFPGRIFKVLKSQSFQTNKAKKLRKSLNISRANIICRNFPWSVQQLRERTKLQEGGDNFLIATNMEDKKPYLWYTERIQ